MAKTLQERLASAKESTRIRSTDLAQLVSDLTAERDRLASHHAKDSADSVDFNLSEPDRDLAAQRADRSGRTIKGLAAEIAGLRERLDAKRQSEAAAIDEAERVAAFAERDALASEIPTMYAEAARMLTELARTIIASDERMKAWPREKGAEAIARGCHNNFHIGSTPVTRLTQIRLPELEGPWDIWPPRGPNFAEAFSFLEPKPRPAPPPLPPLPKIGRARPLLGVAQTS